MLGERTFPGFVIPMTLQIKRLVLNFPGFETTSSTHQIERLTAGGAKTAKLWGFDLKPSGIIESEDGLKTETTFHASTQDWSSETRYVHFSWADIIEKYESVPYPASLISHLPAYLGFFLDGTLRKYRQASLRYWGFTIYPFLLMVIFAVLAWFLASWAAGLIGLGAIISVPLAIALFLVFCRYPGDLLYVNLSVNDWAFARDMCYQINPSIEERYRQFAEQLTQEINDNQPDEILIVGHSFGSVWAVMALHLALAEKPDLLEGRRVTFLAMGSSLLKIALVKKAVFMKQAVMHVLSVKELLWHEIQTKTDFVSFYKSDPFEPLELRPGDATVIIQRVNFKKALSKQRHRKMMKSMYLAHRQYILYCDVRVHHDYQLRVFGPFFADELAKDPELAFQSPLIETGTAT